LIACESHLLPFCAVLPDASIVQPLNHRFRGGSTSSLGVFQRFPLHRTTLLESTPRPRFPGSLRKKACEVPLLVPPLGFLNPSTAFSSNNLRLCFKPLPILGFSAFPSATKQTSSPCCPALQSVPSARSDENLRYRRLTWGVRQGFLLFPTRNLHRHPCPLFLSRPHCCAW